MKWGLAFLALLLLLGVVAWALGLQAWQKILSEVLGIVVVGVIFIFVLQQRGDWKRLGQDRRTRARTRRM